jgi:hypothetical protein
MVIFRDEESALEPYGVRIPDRTMSSDARLKGPS